MRVACLVPYPLDRVPGQRFRLEQWAKPLAIEGVHLEFLPLLSNSEMDTLYERGHTLQKSKAMLAGLLERSRWLRLAPSFDAAVVYREAVMIGVDWIEQKLSRLVPTVFDFDDAVWIPNVSPANRRFQALKGFSKIDRIVRSAHAVSAGCEYLAAYARERNANVFVTPTSIDLDAYGRPREHAESAILRIGWTGSTTTGIYLHGIADALRLASQEFPLELVSLGADVHIPGVRVQCIPWTAAAEIATIRTFDVGVKPTPRESWVLGKCPMKDIQYMALGIPPIATRFGTTLESIEHGRTGFLCESADDWVAALRKLRDTKLRIEIGAAARRVVEERYSSQSSAAIFLSAIRSAQRRFASTEH